MVTHSFALPPVGFSGFAANSRGDIMFIDQVHQKMVRYNNGPSGISYENSYFGVAALAITVDVDDRLYVFNTSVQEGPFTLDVFDEDMNFLWEIINFSDLPIPPPLNIAYLTVTTDFRVYGVQNTLTFAVVMMNTGTVLNIPYLPTDKTCTGLVAIDSRYLVFTFLGDYNLYIWTIQ
jgi:hypothetical protein